MLDATKVRRLQARVGVTTDGAFGPATLDATLEALVPPGLAAAGDAAAGPVSPIPAPGPSAPPGKAELFARLSNRNAPALTDGDFIRVAGALGVQPGIIRAVRAVEAPRGPFDDQGRPSILYEKHIFSRYTGHRFDGSHPVLSARSWQPGTYGPFSAQYGKLMAAYDLDPEAAFEACSWGAFQVLGANAVSLGYASAIEMALALTVSEAAHLDCFARFVRVNGLADELQACRPGDPASCIPFVRGYNGPGYAANNYHVKLAGAAR